MTVPAEEPVLAIDFGTTATAAAVWWHGQQRPLGFLQSNWMSSAIFRDRAGQLLVGTDAERRAVTDPLSFEPTPKRRMEESAAGDLVLGNQRIPVVAAVAAVLRSVVTMAELQFPGVSDGAVVFTHPARWRSHRLAALVEAARLAGLSHPRLLPEPVAAAVAFLRDGRSGGPDGTTCCVYDVGGGTFDVAVVSDRDGTAEVIGPPGGIDHLGGVDFDRRLLDHVGSTVRQRDPAGWQRLAEPTDTQARTDRRHLLDEIRQAKEQLSTQQTAYVIVPGVDAQHAEVMVTRSEFEALVVPLLQQTVGEVRQTMYRAGVTPEDLTHLVLTGGSSRIPAVSELLWRELGVEPVTEGEPKLIVALGAVEARRRGLIDTPSAPPPPPPPPPDAEQERLRLERHRAAQLERRRLEQQRATEEEHRRLAEVQAAEAERRRLESLRLADAARLRLERANVAEPEQDRPEPDGAAEAERRRLAEHAAAERRRDRGSQIGGTIGGAVGLVIFFAAQETPGPGFNFGLYLILLAASAVAGGAFGAALGLTVAWAVNRSVTRRKPSG
ncbi:Hsp70 family protein [Nakamurella leprariae]|uniref:Hsp70 family protein n=1 Tax=Nakamurella leprariae TaxID=2803911 RepID=A0A938YIU2_9ACTN|nr:Hsp70 family protein [Nakamurella leprariae]MBM9468648.1 Hsp70 family protein [Nakamurella leprariae]